MKTLSKLGGFAGSVVAGIYLQDKILFFKASSLDFVFMNIRRYTTVRIIIEKVVRDLS
jgi:hypothetical protein